MEKCHHPVADDDDIYKVLEKVRKQNWEMWEMLEMLEMWKCGDVEKSLLGFEGSEFGANLAHFKRIPRYMGGPYPCKAQDAAGLVHCRDYPEKKAEGWS